MANVTIFWSLKFIQLQSIGVLDLSLAGQVKHALHCSMLSFKEENFLKCFAYVKYGQKRTDIKWKEKGIIRIGE